MGAVIVDDDIGAHRLLRRPVDPDDVADFTAQSPAVQILSIARDQYLERRAQIDLIVVLDVRAVPRLNVMKKRDRGTDDIDALLGEHPGQPGIAARAAPAIDEAVAKIIVEGFAQPVAVEVNAGRARTPQALAEQSAQRRLAAARQAGDPIDAAEIFRVVQGTYTVSVRFIDGFNAIEFH